MIDRRVETASGSLALAVFPIVAILNLHFSLSTPNLQQPMHFPTCRAGVDLSRSPPSPRWGHVSAGGSGPFPLLL